MFIILEGADGSGKSSIAEAIATKLRDKNRNVLHVHNGRPDELTRRWVLHHYAIDIEAHDVASSDIVADRWHWGEATYAPTKRPETNADGFGLLGVPGWRWVELFLASRGALQTWITQPLSVIESRLSARGDDFVNVSELSGIVERYMATARAAHDVLRFMPDDGRAGIDSAAEIVIDAAQHKSAQAANLRRFPEYIGPPKPRALLVGDRRNDPTVTLLPFMPVDHNSGDFLMSALPESLWRNVGIINTGDVFDDRLIDLYEVLGRPRIVVLGRMGEREIRNCGLHVNECAVVPHPQYVRRFHHHDRESYGLAIEAFATGTDEHKERFSHWILP